MAKKREQQEAEIPISSMIDIVFLLIIFFVVTASLDKEVEDEMIRLANSPHGKPLTKKDPRGVTINIRENGKINVSGRLVDMGTLSAILTNQAAKYGNDIPIVIRGDRNVQHGYIKKVMDAVTNTKLYRVKFQAEKLERK
ncbi:MAG: biopolymer transporter ExbD [Victivallales bacterium]|nr:biopolymer transporter ExbD [Victivallales bacterium]